MVQELWVLEIHCNSQISIQICDHGQFAHCSTICWVLNVVAAIAGHPDMAYMYYFKFATIVMTQVGDSSKLHVLIYRESPSDGIHVLMGRLRRREAPSEKHAGELQRHRALQKAHPKGQCGEGGCVKQSRAVRGALVAVITLQGAPRRLAAFSQSTLLVVDMPCLARPKSESVYTTRTHLEQVLGVR
jgi:hypothetical protein